MAALDIPFAVGATVWHAHITRGPFLVPCPACAGTLKATVILGNGETHVVWCDNCSAHHCYDYDYNWREGQNHPGSVTKYEIRAEVESVTLTDVEVRGDEVTYHDARRHYFYAKDLFADEATARHHAETVLAPAAQKQADEEFAQHVFHSRSKTALTKQAGSAASWRKRRAEVAADLARIDRRIERLKSSNPAAPAATKGE